MNKHQSGTRYKGTKVQITMIHHQSGTKCNGIYIITKCKLQKYKVQQDKSSKCKDILSLSIKVQSTKVHYQSVYTVHSLIHFCILLPQVYIVQVVAL